MGTVGGRGGGAGEGCKVSVYMRESILFYHC